ncbi:Hypothetical predicted protein [Podarcis lilfordi]|uniref:Uncharacterized protein n=1 Tax=Podarcis lilfordi TaxID=74358 RepID=A0AA35PBG4_9SAUR|nr:Hypothetical predicted protein [Podarcis lilfordi]
MSLFQTAFETRVLKHSIYLGNQQFKVYFSLGMTILKCVFGFWLLCQSVKAHERHILQQLASSRYLLVSPIITNVFIFHVLATLLPKTKILLRTKCTTPDMYRVLDGTSTA